MAAIQEFTCCHCGNTFPIDKNFAKTHSEFFLATNRLPMCNQCVNDIYILFFERYKDQYLAIQRACMMFDLYYDQDIAESCVKNNSQEKLMGSYVRKIGLPQYKLKSFDTTLQKGFTFKPFVNKGVVGFDFDETPHPEDIQRWGAGLSFTDYKALNDHYEFLKNANPNCDSNQEIFITDLCYIKMQQMKAIREGRPDDYSKMAEQYRKSFTQAGLKTVRDTSANEDFAIGVTAEMIEKYTPAEYYKDKKLYKDHDNIGDYFERFLLRPLRNLQHGSVDRDYEFYVVDEDDSDDFSDD